MMAWHGGRPGCLSTGPRWPRPAASCAARRCGSSGCRCYLLTAGRVSAATAVAAVARAGVDAAGLTRPWRPTTPPRPPGAPTRPASRPTWSGRRTGRRFRSSTSRSGPGWPTPRPCSPSAALWSRNTPAQVRRADGAVVPGLYAAGRTAVGLCSHSYVSGLSLADCVFSGRRAGRSAAAANPACAAPFAVAAPLITREGDGCANDDNVALRIFNGRGCGWRVRPRTVAGILVAGVPGFMLDL